MAKEILKLKEFLLELFKLVLNKGLSYFFSSRLTSKPLNVQDVSMLKSLLNLLEINSNLDETFETFISTKLDSVFMSPIDKQRLVEKNKLIFKFIDMLPLGTKKSYPYVKKWFLPSLVVNISVNLNTNLFSYILEQNSKLQSEFVEKLESSVIIYSQNQIRQAYDAEQVGFIQKVLTNFDAHLKSKHHQMETESFALSLNSDLVNEEIKSQFRLRFK